MRLLLKSKLKIQKTLLNQYQNAFDLLQKLNCYCQKSMFVGGFSRILLLQYFKNQKTNCHTNNLVYYTSPPSPSNIDFDIATYMLPSQIIQFAQKNDIKYIETGISHGTVTLIYNCETFEITTLRADIQTDGRHAKIKFINQDYKNIFQNETNNATLNNTKNLIHNSFFKDSLRRDFTINSIFIDENGDVFDFHDGISHLEQGKIQFIGNLLTRIREDYLRIFRFFRFIYKFSHKVNQNDVEKIEKIAHEINKKDENQKYILSGERILCEMIKIVEIFILNFNLSQVKNHDTTHCINSFNLILNSMENVLYQIANTMTNNLPDIKTTLNLNKHEIITLIFWTNFNDFQLVHQRLKFNKEVIRYSKQLQQFYMQFDCIFQNFENNYRKFQKLFCFFYQSLKKDNDFLYKKIMIFSKNYATFKKKYPQITHLYDFMKKLINLLILSEHKNLFICYFYIYFAKKNDKTGNDRIKNDRIKNDVIENYVIDNNEIEKFQEVIFNQKKNEIINQIVNTLQKFVCEMKFEFLLTGGGILVLINQNDEKRIGNNNIHLMKKMLHDAQGYWADSFAQASKDDCIKYLQKKYME